jgi:hypothetical protein
MIYKPNKKEIKQLKELHRGYNFLKKGFEIIIKNIPKKDSDIEVYAYRASKNIENILKRVTELLEVQYVDKEFFKITEMFNKKSKSK